VSNALALEYVTNIFLIPHLEFPERDGIEHKERAEEWASLPEKDRDAHFKKHGARWFEFGHLLYFNPIRMTIINPMHNLLMGDYRDHR
jgi:hypothetical protein